MEIMYDMRKATAVLPTRTPRSPYSEPLIQSVGASILYQSPYSPDFNPIEHWWSQLKAFLRQFSPTNSKI